MNLTRSGLSPIHESNLKPRATYFLKLPTWGEGYVKLLEDKGSDGWEVEIVEGGFNIPPKTKYRVGDVMTVWNNSGQWYEMKGVENG